MSKGPSTTSQGSLTLAALGVVFGDIGTSPLYAFKEAFSHGGLAATSANVLAILSLIFWSVMLIVTLKYVAFMLRFGNEGEGGVLALLALAQRHARGQSVTMVAVTLLGIFAASLFYGDALITPAISVLSAVEGLHLVSDEFDHWVIPIALLVLIGLFSMQRFGTSKVGNLFGPITVVWFVVMALLGVNSIVDNPEVLQALNPRHAVNFLLDHPGKSMIALGAVFLALTGGEALYADMGHFGANPIRIGWFGLALPALMLNYFGQGAMVLRSPQSVENPFFLLVSPELTIPLVVLATMATVIASQATISGAFSITLQAIRLGYLPRFRIVHTSSEEKGQIYIPLINHSLLILVIWLVLEFQTSGALASAYGIAVSGTMICTTLLVGYLIWARNARFKFVLLLLAGAYLVIELIFLSANATKFFEGGWFPVLFGLGVFTLLTTYRTGMEFVDAQRDDFPLDIFLHGIPDIHRVAGTAVFITHKLGTIPGTLLHNLKHNQVLHEQVLLLHVTTEDIPEVHDRDRLTLSKHPHGVIEVQVRYGFREQPNVPRIMALLEQRSVHTDMMQTSFFLGKNVLISRPSTEGLFSFRRKLFAWMLRVGGGAPEYYQLPPNRVLEIGQQVVI